MIGHFTGYSEYHPTEGPDPHDVRLAVGAGQAIVVCFTCETFQTLDTIEAGLPIMTKEGVSEN